MRNLVARLRAHRLEALPDVPARVKVDIDRLSLRAILDGALQRSNARGATAVSAADAEHDQAVRLVLCHEVLGGLDAIGTAIAPPDIFHAPVDRRERTFKEGEGESSREGVERHHQRAVTPAHTVRRLRPFITRARSLSRSSRLRSADGDRWRSRR